MLGHSFHNPDLLEEALRHSSFVNEQAGSDLRDNERLEFLGDAVINLVVGHMLMGRFPDLREGGLSRMRANLVNESRLAGIARKLGLGEFIQLGKGEEQTSGRDKNSILADTLEAVTAAVYLDGGFEAAFRLLENHFVPLLETIRRPFANRDYKSRLQEMVQERQSAVPLYRVVAESGPDHDKTFDVEVAVGPERIRGSGRSKKLAEQEAARRALSTLFENEEG